MCIRDRLYAEVNVEAITFNKGYYTVDVTYFYKITGETLSLIHILRR